MINWKVRFKNRIWVLSFLSQMMLVVQVFLSALNSLGVTDFQLTEEVKSEILSLANSVFVVLSMLGIVQDPTTKGYQDSERAMKYDKPK